MPDFHQPTEHDPDAPLDPMPAERAEDAEEVERLRRERARDRQAAEAACDDGST